MSTGHSPQGSRPEPTVAPQTPAPCTPADDTTAAQQEATKSELLRLYWFIHVRLRQNHSSEGDWERLGRMTGRGEAAIELGRLDAARTEFERLREMAQQWSDHPEYRQAVEGQA
ncbi:hypothetical protein GQF42_01350 [Streptomyces broussonetiae]|uniref:Tetratricopeptide repeat protein n=1 Tax=Streptomyces broussonetiae TaxID=2686304 RepID=A0A6I6MV37_9ACTN|nr:hypothetical protein [Streptomyces broussonetiae]QHA02169.1 hypothetical protein GQF42_01350 [Streptomyces broussonetiae]